VQYYLLHAIAAAAKSEAEAQKEKADKPRTLLEASKELKRATEAMDSRTQRFVKQQDEESRVLAEANQVTFTQLKLCTFTDSQHDSHVYTPSSLQLLRSCT
jgi:hypothetical protein